MYAEQEFSAIMAEYETRLLHYVGQLIGPMSDEVQDIVQDTFLRLHRQINKHGRESIKHLSCWLYRVAHNRTMDIGRKRQSRYRLQEKMMHDPTTKNDSEPAKEFRHKESCGIAMDKLQKLPEEQKNILLLKIIEGFTLKQISELTGLKIGTVNYRLTQGLSTLSLELKKVGAI